MHNLILYHCDNCTVTIRKFDITSIEILYAIFISDVDGCSLMASQSVLGRNGERKTLPKQLGTPWSRNLLQKLKDPQPVKKFREFYGIRRFITAFT
jgi:hypothetical protein